MACYRFHCKFVIFICPLNKHWNHNWLTRILHWEWLQRITDRSHIRSQYLVDGISKCIVVVIKCCIKLCLTSCSQNPDDFFITVSFIWDLLMKYLSLWFCQHRVHLFSLVSECTYKGNQQLLITIINTELSDSELISLMRYHKSKRRSIKTQDLCKKCIWILRQEKWITHTDLIQTSTTDMS